MELAFLTNAFKGAELNTIAKWGTDHGFRNLEIGPWIPLDISEIEKTLRRYEIRPIAFIYARNMMSPDATERAEHRRNLEERIEAASRLGVRYVTTATGVDEEKNLDENFTELREWLLPTLDRAEEGNVTICIENCPDMWNLAHSPVRWKRLFDEIPRKNLKLCLDPSHLIRLMIDPYSAAEDFAERVAYVHGKDTQIYEHRLRTHGILDQRAWWDYRLPGMGDLNWSKFLSILVANRFDGVISIEHEDPVWEGTETRVKAGIIKAKSFLESLVTENSNKLQS